MKLGVRKMKRAAEFITQENIMSAKSLLINKLTPTMPTSKMAKNYLATKFNEMNNFYKNVTGLDELEFYQDRVIELQNSLNDAQLKRREISYMLNDARKRGMDIQDRLHKVKRHEQPALFLQLMNEETEFIKRERDLQSTLGEQERHEREIFTAFTNAIRDSQEKQRNRLEYSKYIGCGLTVLGALISYFITSWRQEDLKNVIRNSIKADVGQISKLGERLNAIEKVSITSANAVMNVCKEVIQLKNTPPFQQMPFMQQQPLVPIPEEIKANVLSGIALITLVCFVISVCHCC